MGTVGLGRGSTIDKSSPQPYYWQVSQKIREAILLGGHKRGDKLPSERDLALYFGVSRVTVRGSLDLLMQEGVLAKVDRKGIFVSADFRPEPRIRKIGFTIWHDENSSYHPASLELMRGINEALQGEDARVELLTITPQMVAASDYSTITGAGLQGLILTVREVPDADLERLATVLPVISTRYKAVNSVYVDFFNATYKVTQYLLGLRHRRIGLVHGPIHFDSSQQTCLGFARAFSEAGLFPEPALIVNGEYDYQCGLSAGMELMTSAEPPTALIVGDDFMALGVLEALKKLGLNCPEDLSLVSFGDFEFARAVSPPLTTVRIDYYRLGRELASLLSEITGAGGRDCPGRSIKGEVIVRDSVKAL